MGDIFRFINGPSRTRAFSWDISASCTAGMELIGSCSAFGGGVEFTIRNGGSGMVLSCRGGTYSLTSGTGTFSVTVPTQERIDLESGAGLSGVTIYEQATSTMSCSLSLGGVSLSWTVTLTGVGPSIAARCYAQCAGSVAGNGSAALTISPTATLPFDAEEGALSRSKSGTLSASGGGSTWSGSWSVSESVGYGASASATYSLTENGVPTNALPPGLYWGGGSTWRNYGAYAEAVTTADRAGSLSTRLQSVDAASSQSWEYQLTPTGARYTGTGASSTDVLLRYRRRWIGGYMSPSDTYDTLTDHKSEQNPLSVKAKMVGQSDALQMTLPLRLWRWSALELAHDATKTVDTCSSLTPTGTFAATWSAGGGGSVSIASGAVKLTGSAGKTLTRTSASTLSKFHGYTRLRLRLRCSAASHTIRVQAGPSIWDGAGYASKYWDVVTGAANTWTDIYIDHAGEHNGLPISRANSIWEDTIDPETRGWHLLNISGDYLVLSSLGAGDYEVDVIELDDAVPYTGASTTPMIHALPQYVSSYGDTMRILVASCAGTQTLDLLTNTTSTIAEVPTFMGTSGSQYTPGWSSSDLAPQIGGMTIGAVLGGGPYGGSSNLYIYDTFSDKTCSIFPARWLGGLQWTGSAWQHCYGDGALAVGAIPAQWQVASLVWFWPEALDSLPGGGALGAGMVIGGGVWGQMRGQVDIGTNPHRPVISGDADALGSGVRPDDTDAIAAGTGAYSLPTFGEEGFYLPGGGANNYRITATDSTQVPVPTAVVPLVLGRRRLVLCEGSTSATGACLTIAQSFTGRLARAWKPTSGNILLEMRSQAGGGWSRVDTGISGSCPALAWDTPSVNGALLMVYESSGIKLVESLNEGSTWSMATTIASSGSHGVPCVSQSGVRHFFWYASGAIKRRSYDAQMQQVIAAGNVVASGAADDCPAVVCLMDGSILLTYRTTAGALIALTSTDGAVTFT